VITDSTKALVRTRASNRCEYCQLPQEDSPLAPLHIEHIIPQKHGGSDDLDNLALACIDCNLHKGSNLTGIDPETNEVMELFHPRLQEWSTHFAWDGISIVGLTAIGRTTVRVLAMNSDDQLALRSSE
jgi:hypothetical protein